MDRIPPSRFGIIRDPSLGSAPPRGPPRVIPLPRQFLLVTFASGNRFHRSADTDRHPLPLRLLPPSKIPLRPGRPAFPRRVAPPVDRSILHPLATPCVIGPPPSKLSLLVSRAEIGHLGRERDHGSRIVAVQVLDTEILDTDPLLAARLSPRPRSSSPRPCGDLVVERGRTRPFSGIFPLPDVEEVRERGNIAIARLGAVLVARQRATNGQQAEEEQEEEGEGEEKGIGGRERWQEETRGIATRVDARHNQSPSTSLVRRLEASRRLLLI